MIILMWFLSATVLLTLLFFFALMPRTEMHQQCSEFKGLYFAHRGLWSSADHIPENSLQAFRRAIASGYAIELDVHLTKDGKAVIFHDDTLKRMCGKDRFIWDCSYDELQTLYLAGTREQIPLLSTVLKLVDGKVKLLIELKAHRNDTKICQVVTDILTDYKGKYCIESFSPFILHWYKKHQPQVIRGQLSCRFDSSVSHPRPLLFLSEHLMFNWYSRPDFIAYEFHRGAHLRNLEILRTWFGTPAFAWTIHSENALKSSRKYFDSVIFDRFIPKYPLQKTEE